MNLKVYIACSLTHVPRKSFEEYAASIHRIANLVKGCSFKYALTNSDPQLESIPENEKAKYCYLWDRKMVEEADLIIAEASFASIGLGIELQIAEMKNIPIILIHRQIESLKVEPIKYENPDHNMHSLQIGKGYVSLMALGLPNILKLIPYQNIEECIKEIQIEIDKVKI